MSTVEPHTPAPGWFWRWILQSVQLLPRMGASAIAHASTYFGSHRMIEAYIALYGDMLSART